MNKNFIILLMCMVWFCCTAIQAQVIPNNEIHYTAIKKLKMTSDAFKGGLHYREFRTKIKSHKFSKGKGVIIFENDVSSIGGHAFYGCTDLINIILPNSVTRIGEWAFMNCSILRSIEIPNSVKSIESEAFSHCKDLESITIPNSVESINEYAFIDCPSLYSIIVDSGNTKYDSRDKCNAIIESNSNTLITGCKNTIIPNSVERIGNCAFYGSSFLKSITIPNSVTSIGESAFRDCSRLVSVSMPQRCDMKNKYTVFHGCSSDLEINNKPLYYNSTSSVSNSSSKKSNSASSNNLCSRCNGSGTLMFQPCPFCGGTGRIVWNLNSNNSAPSGGYISTPTTPTTGGASGGTNGGYSTPKQNNGRDCPECHGTGNCQTCNGSGLDYSYPSNGTKSCAVCHGKKKCTRCNGTGKVY